MTNFVSIAGNLASNPEVSYTPSGMACARFSVALDHRKYSKTEKKYTTEHTSFIRCVLWGHAAEHLAESAGKGSRVCVTGELRQNTFQDKAGNNRSSVEVTAREVSVSTLWAPVTVSGKDASSAGVGGGGFGGASGESSSGFGGGEDEPPF